MTIRPTTRDKMIAAMEKFDAKLRSTPEWTKWQNNFNHLWAIKHQRKLYPVKEIISMANGQPTADFHGGVGPGKANEYAQARGFTIFQLRSRNPNWTRDELIVTLDFYLRHRPKFPSQGTHEITELSRQLNKIGRRIFSSVGSDFRNTNGVYMKLMNFNAIDPANAGKGLPKGGAADRLIWQEFGSKPALCAQVARTILAAVNDLEKTDDDETDDDDIEAEEGAVVAKMHRRRERNRKIVQKKKSAAMKSGNGLRCEACHIQFRDVYGNRGDSFIECHHIKPVHTMKPGEKTKLSDLILLCSNCHRMVHANRDWFTLEQLQALPGVRRARAFFQALNKPAWNESNR